MDANISCDRAKWMTEALYGIGVHWTAQSLPRKKTGPFLFKEAVEKFNVKLMAEQCAEAGAGWLLFTIAHALQYLPCPSKTMDAILPGRTSGRDMLGELIGSLSALGIKTVFYYPSVAGDDDPDWQRASDWLYDPASYAARQYDIVAEIGERYGAGLAGWWLDNCYDPRCHATRNHHLHPSKSGFSYLYDLQHYASALRTGNPDRLVTFNFTGTHGWNSQLGKGIIDYGAGESNDLDRVPYGPFTGESGARWHSFVWMDEGDKPCGWVHTEPGEVGPPRYSTEHIADYLRYLKKHGGAFTYGAAPYQDELIAESTMMQLRELGAVSW